MLAKGDTASLLSRACTQDKVSIHSFFEGQGIENCRENYERCLNSNMGQGGPTSKRKSLARLRSAPELYKPELPPICPTRTTTYTGRLKNRPLTPLVVKSKEPTGRSTSRNYLINLDLVPLVEVGNGVGNLSIGTRRTTSVSSDSSLSRSTPSPRLIHTRQAKEDPSALQRSSYAQKKESSSPTDTDEESCSDSDEAEGKDTMILQWLQTVKRSQDHALHNTNELLPCITEGKLA